MATGNFGTKRPADVALEDIDIFYTFSPSREENSNSVFRLTTNEVLTPLNEPTDEGLNVLGGLYNLTLPQTTFNEVGVYTIYIRPKQINTTISDCGVLSALPDVKGILLDTTATELQDLSDRFNSNGLVGYRIEYLDNSGVKQNNLFRIVTSSNKAEPVTENVGNTTQTTVRYRFNDSGTLLFLTLTPSSATSVKPNSTPFIGNPNQTIILTNTFFNPLAIEVELTEYSLETLNNAIFGNQTRSISDGIVSYYDDFGNIVSQYDLFVIKDDAQNPIYEVKRKRSEIDETKDFDTIIQQLNL